MLKQMRISSICYPVRSFLNQICSGTKAPNQTTTSQISRNMKLLTHNMLSSKAMKGVQVGYPLELHATDVKVTELDFNSEFISRIIPKLDWPVLVKAASAIGKVDELPETITQELENDTDFLKKVHHVLLEVEVVNGELICPETGRKFPISNGIPNMLLNEDEV